MKKLARVTGWVLAVVLMLGASPAVAANPFLGEWALTIPGGGAGWLGITQEDKYLDGGILWGGGSVMPLASVYMDGDKLHVTRVHKVERRDEAGKVVRRHTFTEDIVATLSGDKLSLTQSRAKENGRGVVVREFTGVRQPPMPEAPDLKRVKFGKAISLLDGKSLDGWTLTNEKQANGWSVRDGLLVNNPVQEEGKKHKSYGNLRTVDEFEDFNLTLDFKVGKKGNSGVYLRGIYEVQVADSYGRPADSHGVGGIYSRIKPSSNPAKAPGKWQSFDITLVDRHVTVVLNGETIIDNEPLLGCTGGALWSDVLRPGPIYLQGDHTAVEYRNIMLRPVK